MEYYIYNIPVFVIGEPPPHVSIPEFCADAEETIASAILVNVDVVYIGEMRELNGRNATYHNGAIYMTNMEPTIDDMLESGRTFLVAEDTPLKYMLETDPREKVKQLAKKAKFFKLGKRTPEIIHKG